MNCPRGDRSAFQPQRVVVLDENDRVVYQKRLANELAGIVAALRS